MEIWINNNIGSKIIKCTNAPMQVEAIVNSSVSSAVSQHVHSKRCDGVEGILVTF